MYCLRQQQAHAAKAAANGHANGAEHESDSDDGDAAAKNVPALFSDAGYATLGESVLSTSNCGNPALRLFGFGPVAANGFGIGYIIKVSNRWKSTGDLC